MIRVGGRGGSFDEGALFGKDAEPCLPRAQGWRWRVFAIAMMLAPRLSVRQENELSKQQPVVVA
jgi:hypothetical protein